MNKNKLIIAAAGSGKTTYLVEIAKKIKHENVLITTYTEENETEIRRKFYGRIPSNITIQTWFSFLLQHGVRPYQSVLNDGLHEMKIGFYLTERPSGIRFYNRTGQPVYWGDRDFFKFYFSKDMKIYSDKISKFIVECNQKTVCEVINRITRIYPNIFIDEIQDLAGWELEILKSLFNSVSKIILVGDPRQVTYLTHHPRKYPKYKDGKIKEFIEYEYNGKKNINVEIDEITLLKSHRNNKWICDFSSKLYPNYPICEPCECECCRNYVEDHEGIFLVRKRDVEVYLRKYKPIQLRWSSSAEVNPDFRAHNFGKSKGLSFERVLIYPTSDMKKWIFDNSYGLKPETRAKFYLAITRAKYSVGIVCDYPEDFIETDTLGKWNVV